MKLCCSLGQSVHRFNSLARLHQIARNVFCQLIRWSTIAEMSEGTEPRAAKRDFSWLAVLWCIHLNALGLYGIFLVFAQAKWMTIIFFVLMIFVTNLGMTLGAHRLWAHRTFEAQGPVRLFLMLAQTLAGVGSIYDWVLSHRIHHEYYGTEKDPYNHKRGFLYSHLFSNLVTTHPQHEELVKSIDMRDVELDGYVLFQRLFYWPLFIVIGLLLPMNAPVQYWGESLLNAFFILGFLRLAVSAQLAWLINSAMLIWGLKPGDKFPADDNSVFIVTKSYWLNYHYLLNWDYKSGEFGSYDSGCTSLILDLWASLNWVSLRTTPSSQSIRDAFYSVATNKNLTIEEALDGVKKIAEKDALTLNLTYRH